MVDRPQDGRAIHRHLRRVQLTTRHGDEIVRREAIRSVWRGGLRGGVVAQGAQGALSTKAAYWGLGGVHCWEVSWGSIGWAGGGGSREVYVNSTKIGEAAGLDIRRKIYKIAGGKWTLASFEGDVQDRKLADG